VPFFRACFIGTCLNVAVSLFKLGVITGYLKMFIYMYIGLYTSEVVCILMYIGAGIS